MSLLTGVFALRARHVRSIENGGGDKADQSECKLAIRKLFRDARASGNVARLEPRVEQGDARKIGAGQSR